MALQQFNQFEPKIAGLEGNMQAEPRVFAHDAATASGNGFIVGEVITYAGGSVAGAGLVLTVTAIDGGAVTNFDVTTVGSIYVVGESLTFTTSLAGAAFTVDVRNIDIPNTQRRGCCLYSGASQTVQVELESGNTVSFVGVNAGSFLPILAKRLVTGTNILALY